MWRSLRWRVLLTHVGINCLFSFLVTWVYILSLNLKSHDDQVLVLLLYLLIFTSSQVFFLLWLLRYLNPLKDLSTTLEDPSCRGRGSVALARLYHFPSAYSLRLAIVWLSAYLLLALLLQFAYVDQLDIGVNIVPVTLFISMVCFFGGLAILAPIMVFATEPVTAQISSQAFKLGIRPFKKSSAAGKALQRKLTVFVATAAWLFLLAFNVYEDANNQANRNNAQQALQELLLEHPLRASTNLKRWRKDIEEQLGKSQDLYFLFSAKKEPLLWLETIQILDDSEQRALLFDRLNIALKGTLLLRGRRRVIAFRELSDGRCIGLIRPCSALLLTETAFLFFIFGAALFGFAVLCSALFSRSLRRPVNRLQQLCTTLQHGRVDQAAFIPVVEQDELGELVTVFNLFLQSFKELAVFARFIADGRLDIEIVGDGDLQTSFRVLLLSLRATVQDISRASHSLSTIGTKLLDASQAMTASSGEQARTIDEVSLVMEELNKGIEHVSQSMDRIRLSADQNQQSAELSMTRISQLSEQLETTQELLKSIRKISRQSRMLALNASIESARAGTAGDSFGVVALETRRLSEEIDASAQKISELLEKMERAGDLTELTAKENKNFAVSMAEMAQDISAVAWQQQQSTQQITERVRRASDSVTETVQASEESCQDAEELYDEADNLKKIMSRFGNLEN
jgi:methyl-accepting chemotaxis protein